MSHLLAQVNIPYAGGVADFKFTSSNNLVGDIVSQLLLVAIALAGFIFLVKLIMAGYGYLTSAGDSAKIAGATKNLTNAGLGLFVVLTTFFIAQILQKVLGINIL